MKTTFTNIKYLYGVEDDSTSIEKVSGEELSSIPTLSDAYLSIEGERIIDFGRMKDFSPSSNEKLIDVEKKCVFPTYVDSHTHIVWADDRSSEFVDRIKGLSYEEIATNGGGILNSAKRLQDTDFDSLYQQASRRLEEVISYGTGAIEIKSGYGLSFDAEIKMLRVIQKLKENYNIPIRATFLGAHAIPQSYQNNRAEYLKLVIDEMLPYVAKENLADYCDVFCDEGFFTVEETDRILEAASKYGLKAKIHANELANSGGVQIGIKNEALSVDHLERIEQKEIDALKNSNTMPTLLPGCAFYLGIPYPPARKMIDQGLPVCLASDYNPGSTPSGNMNFVVSLACIKMKMLPAEAFQAATINGASALEWSSELGTIKKGKLANFFISTPISSINYLPYAYTQNNVDDVYIKGKLMS